MKRIFLILTLTLIPLAAVVAETGVGAAIAYGYDNGKNNVGGVLTLSTPAIPGTIQTVRLGFTGSDYINFAVSDDWWVIQRNLTGQLNYYIGMGFYAGFAIYGNETDFSLGGRVPLGLTIRPIDFMEFFLEVAPAIGLGFEPELYFPSWNTQAALGFRLWF